MKYRLKNVVAVAGPENGDYENDLNIFLYGIVGWDFDAHKLLSAVEKSGPGTDTLNLYIHSPGGIVDEGLAMITAIERLKKKYNVYTFIDGLAASFGSTLAVSGETVTASPTSRMMIHDALVGFDLWGQFNARDIDRLIADMGEVAENLRTANQVMAWPYAQKTGLSHEEVVANWLNGTDHWFSPEQMLENKLADRIDSAEFVRPDDVEIMQDDEWMELFAHELAPRIAAMDTPYRGVGEKIVTSVANVKKSSNTISSTGRTPLQITEPTPKPTGDPMKFAVIARACGLAPEVDDQPIVAYINTLQANLQKALDEVATSKTTLEQFKVLEDRLKKENEDLRALEQAARASTLVDQVVAQAQKSHPGKQVNKAIRAQLDGVATRLVSAQDGDDETMATLLGDHMKLMAENNLVAIGANPDLSDPPRHSRVTSGQGPDAGKLQDARKRGEDAARANARKWGIPFEPTTN